MSTFSIKGKHRRDEGVTDFWLVGAVFLLGMLGLLWINSASTSSSLGNVSKECVRQAVWLCAGFLVAAVLQIRDYHRLARWTWVFYWVAILGLILVLVPGIGAARYGARRWIDLGPVQFQPSELAKLATILALAAFFSRPAEEVRNTKAFLIALGLIALPACLMIVEPDLGSAGVLFPIGFVMMFVAGIPLAYLVRLLIFGFIAAFVVVAHVLWLPPNMKFLPIEPYQELRLLVYFQRTKVPEGATPEQKQALLQAYRDAAYNVEQALISIGSGGMWGKGYKKGQQNQLGYLPRAVAHNDFIFSVVAEESGFIGSIVLITLYSVVIARGLKIANVARDILGRLIVIGVVTLWFSHVFVNIAMNIRLLPVTGLPLPLVSYGGTSTVVFLAAAGLILNVYRYRRS